MSAMRALFRFGVTMALPFVAGCSGDDSHPERGAPALPTLQRVPDENSDPNVVEVTIRAKEATKQYPGSKPSQVWTYEGTVPGPLLEAKVGDQLVVHFHNELPESTSIHWHGLRLPAKMDGTMAMQSPIEPGQSFEYAFELKDAGFFWFHPHVRSDIQIEKGLYGALLVRGAAEPVVDHETVMVLDDVDVRPDGTFPEYLDDESKMMGREGNVLLINGAARPDIALTSGALERLRLVNVANGRFFKLRLEGHTFHVIGTDGGLVPEPWDTETLLMAPGERYDVVLIPTGKPRASFTLWNEPYARGHGSGSAEPMPLGRVRLSDAPALTGRVLPTAFPDIEKLPPGLADMPIALGEAFDGSGSLVFTVNGGTYPNVPPLVAENGSVHVLTVKNESDMDHPFHLHGFFFQRLGEAGKPKNKDTIIVKAHETLELASRFDEPGMWMYHCHILEHAEGGMMGELHVQ
ncbi:MAG: multicopper oxidase family protein [Myxococcales bacterium]|nr:multicopper oxidase family protein [Myxococcales bacterium]